MLINSNPVRARTKSACGRTRGGAPPTCRLTLAPPLRQATIMTDPETANRTYIGPMTPELVETIIAKA